ncbi:hypothetical protein RBU49_15970 [Clostridium sp. MB40-C1]|uniref:hypothetical protein n=1 Tax=Clostridium sp. MB40-C1 TaxID=3070996 RepID=UPI0027DEE66A|nr:hypothetical protein [Clostridium sp. MB40-C1]WMJ80280.1 hypothetical protein RBU49_15970 [Clostridium sp. MB40-C1]
MSEYYLDILGKISLSDYSKIDDYMAIVGEEDNFIITFNDKSIDNSDIVYEMLGNNNFSVNYKGGEEHGKLYISATRNKR